MLWHVCGGVALSALTLSGALIVVQIDLVIVQPLIFVKLSLSDCYDGVPVTRVSTTSSDASPQNITEPSTTEVNANCYTRWDYHAKAVNFHNHKLPIPKHLSPPPALVVLCFHTILSTTVCKMGQADVVEKTHSTENTNHYWEEKHEGLPHVRDCMTPERLLEMVK